MKNYIKFLEGIMWYEDGKFKPDEEPEDEIDDFIHDDQFRQFLIDEGCYEEYIKNVKDLNPDDVNLKTLFNSLNDDDYISSAFSWHDSDQNYQFWWDVDIHWINYLEKNKEDGDKNENFNKFLEGIRWYEDGKFKPDEEPEDEIDDLSLPDKYNDFITDNQFKHFLINNGDYFLYVQNVYEQHPHCMDYIEWFESLPVLNYVNWAFDFKLTEQGEDYWIWVNENWIDIAMTN